MGKFIKRVLVITLIVFIVLITAVAGTLLYFDPNEHKDFIVSRVEKATGRSFSVEGDINLTYYPWLGLEAGGITLGNAKGFGDKPFAHADKVALRIKTMPLLKKTYRLDTFRLHGLQLNLAKNKEGVTNWQDLTAEDDRKAKKREPFELAAVVLGGVDVKNGQISWEDMTTGQKVTVSDLNVTTGELTYGDPIDLNVSLKAESNKPSLSSNVKMDGILTYNLDDEIYAFKPIDLLAIISGKDVPGGTTELVFNAAMETDLGNETFTLSGLNLDILGTSVKGDLSAQNIRSKNMVSQGQLTIKSDDLSKLLKLVDPETGEQIARLSDRSVDMQLNIESDMGEEQVRVSQMDIKVLGSVIKGHVDARQIKSDKPSAKGELTASGPDLPALLQIAGQFQRDSEDGLKTYAQRLSGVSQKSFDIAAEFDADMAQGRVSVPRFKVNALGIDASGNIDAKQLNSSSPKVDGKFNLKGEKLGGLLTALDKKELAAVLQSIDINTTVASQDSDIAFSPLQVSAVLAGKQIPDSPATVTLNADTRINLDKQTLSMQNMTLKGLGLNVAGSMVASQIRSDAPAVEANLDAQGKDLVLLVKLAGMDSLAGQLAGLKDRSFRVKTALNANPGQGQIKVSGLDASLLGAVIKGNVDASNINTDTPAARGNLKATGPDLPALMQVLGLFQAGKDPALVVYGKRLANVDNRAFDISAEFDADLKSGNIQVPTLSFNALGIKADGRLMAKNFTGEQGSLDGSFNLKAEKPAGVLAAFGQPALGEVMQTINIDTSVKGSGGDYSLSPLQVKATFAGKDIPNSPVDLTLNANTRLNLDKQTLVMDNMSLDGLGLNLKSNINATKIMDDPQFNGNLTLAEFDLRRFANQLKLELPVTADKNVFKKVALKTAFRGSTTSISLKDLALKLDETSLQGNLSVEQFAQPDIKFGLAVDSINADRYLPPETEGKPATPETAAGSAATDLPLETLRALKINGDLQIGRLVISNTTMTDVKLSLKARDGDIRLSPVTADLYQGKYSGNVALNAKGSLPALSVNTELAGVQIEPLLKDYLQEEQSPAVGVANISFDPLTAVGNNADQMKQSLTGKGQFSVTDGVVRGIDVRRALEQAEVMLESKQIPRVEKGGETAFEKLTGTLDINNGVVKNKDLLMLSTGFRVTGKGTMANLKNDSIDYNLLASIDESRAERGESTFNIGGYDVPVRCRGKFDDIASACKPDLEELFKVAIKKGALEKLGESLGVPLPGTKESTQQESTQQETTQSSSPDSETTEAESTTSPDKTTKKEKSSEEQLKEGLKDALKGLFD